MGRDAPWDRLGVFARETLRTLVVLSRDGELAVAVREQLEPAMVVVRDARPHEAAAVLDACRPWPWMVVSDLDDAPDALQVLATRAPLIALWLGAAPASVPFALSEPRFRDLALRLRGALHGCVAGVRLAPGRGVSAGGRLAYSPALEALLGAHPEGVHMPARCTAQAERALAVLRAPLQLQHCSGGVVRLDDPAAALTVVRA